MLVLKNISLSLEKGTKLERQIFSKLNLTVEEGEFVVLIGENGSGKSTLLNIISGFLKPNHGQIFIEGQDITHFVPASCVSIVMQDPRIGTMQNLTIFENMAFAFKHGMKRTLIPFNTQARKTLFQEKLSMLNMGLENRLDTLVSNLSGGQRQALSFIMATLSHAKILLLDEITSALDTKTANTLMRIVDKIIRQEKRTCIMVTHNISHANKFGDRLLTLTNGTITNSYKKQLHNPMDRP